jgi:alpha-L-arabinofuranosidase
MGKSRHANGGPLPTLFIDPTPRFELSPNLYMQFMEPLGATDGSVEAAWDHEHDKWRDDVIQATRELAPPLIRWGGCLSSYYRWEEGVGPRDRRVPFMNLLWGGVESSQVGTHELVDFCRKVGAEPFFAVNFEADGRGRWAHPAKGGPRTAGPEEAAAWIDYCNNPDNRARIANGAREPFGLKLWQIANETSYDPTGYDLETAAARTVAFARAMRKADPGIDLIGWGDSGWARRMLEVAGEHLQYIAFHHMIRPEKDPDSHLRDQESPINGARFRSDPAATWDYLMEIPKIPARKIARVREEIAGYDVKLAKTEGHFAVDGRNRNEVLSTWAAGVSNAMILNVHERNGDLLKIATHADFCGNRWLVNALMFPTPPSKVGKPYLLPTGRVMALYRAHSGEKALAVTGVADGLDVTASRTGDRVTLHVVNTRRTQPVRATLDIKGYAVARARAFEIAVDPMAEIDELTPHLFDPRERTAEHCREWEFPSASVTALELDVRRE